MRGHVAKPSMMRADPMLDREFEADVRVVCPLVRAVDERGPLRAAAGVLAVASSAQTVERPATGLRLRRQRGNADWQPGRLRLPPP